MAEKLTPSLKYVFFTWPVEGGTLYTNTGLYGGLPQKSYLLVPSLEVGGEGCPPLLAPEDGVRDVPGGKLVIEAGDKYTYVEVKGNPDPPCHLGMGIYSNDVSAAVRFYTLKIGNSPAIVFTAGPQELKLPRTDDGRIERSLLGWWELTGGYKYLDYGVGRSAKKPPDKLEVSKALKSNFPPSFEALTPDSPDFGNAIANVVLETIHTRDLAGDRGCDFVLVIDEQGNSFVAAKDPALTKKINDGINADRKNWRAAVKGIPAGAAVHENSVPQPLKRPGIRSVAAAAEDRNGRRILVGNVGPIPKPTLAIDLAVAQGAVNFWAKAARNYAGRKRRKTLVDAARHPFKHLASAREGKSGPGR